MSIKYMTFLLNGVNICMMTAAATLYNHNIELNNLMMMNQSIQCVL